MSDKPHIVVDELIPKELQDKIHMDSKGFLWLYNRSTYQDTNHIITKSVYDVGQLVLPIYYAEGTHAYYENIKPVVEAAQAYLKPIKSLYRAKFNLLWMAPESNGRWNYPHRDSNDIRNLKMDKWSIVYYVNNADGDTVLFYPGEEVRVTPKRGQALIFPSHIKHASSNPQKAMERIVLNIVLETEE
jgi:hypothetical protein